MKLQKLLKIRNMKIPKIKLSQYREYQLSLNLGPELIGRNKIEKDLLDRLIDSDQYELPTPRLYTDIIRYVAGNKFERSQVIQALGHFNSAEWLEYLFSKKLEL